MRIFTLAAIAAISVGATLVAGSTSVAAQDNEQNVRTKKVLGYQNPETGAFEPLVKAVPDTTISPTTGTIDLTLTITLKTALPKGGTILCSGDLIATSENDSTTFSLSVWDESVFSVATVSGSTATCTVTIPYSFHVPAASTTLKNTIEGDYSVEMINATGALPSLVVTLGGTFLNSSLPATGTTTRVAAGVTI